MVPPWVPPVVPPWVPPVAPPVNPPVAPPSVPPEAAPWVPPVVPPWGPPEAAPPVPPVAPPVPVVPEFPVPGSGSSRDSGPSPATTSSPPGAGHALPVTSQMALRSPPLIRPPMPVSRSALTSAPTITMSPRYSTAVWPPSRRHLINRATLKGRCSARRPTGRSNQSREPPRSNRTRVTAGMTNCGTPRAPPPLSVANAPSRNQPSTATRPRQIQMSPERTYSDSANPAAPGSAAYSRSPSSSPSMASSDDARRSTPMPPTTVNTNSVRTRSSTACNGRGSGTLPTGTGTPPKPPDPANPPAPDIPAPNQTL